MREPWLARDSDRDRVEKLAWMISNSPQANRGRVLRRTQTEIAPISMASERNLGSTHYLGGGGDLDLWIQQSKLHRRCAPQSCCRETRPVYTIMRGDFLCDTGPATLDTR